MWDIFSWYLALQVASFVVLPLTLRLFRPLPDGGYAFSKALGLLLLGYLLWLGGSLEVLPNGRGSLLLLLWALALISLLLLRPEVPKLREIWQRERRLWVTVELLFLGSFLLWVYFRAHDPSIAGTEKPMDFAFLNASVRSEFFPPGDPWLSGYSVSYYYFGYLLVAALAKLTGTAPGVAYNLGVALLFALTVVCTFGLVYNLLRVLGAPAAQGRRYALLGCLLVSLLGNWEGGLEYLQARGWGSPGFWSWVEIKDLGRPYVSATWHPSDPWWWWRATRVIDHVVDGRSQDYTITEFPFFSFLLGDLHPHVMALPFTLLALALGLRFLLEPPAVGGRWVLAHPGQTVGAALILGALGFLNSWDLPTYGLLFGGCLVLQGAWPRGKSPGAALGGSTLAVLLVFLLAVGLYLPFYSGFQSQASGVLPWTGPGTRPLHLLLFWGPLFFLLGSLLLYLDARLWGSPLRGGMALLLLAPVAGWLLLEVGPLLWGAEGFLPWRFVLQRVWMLFPLVGVAILGRRVLAQRAEGGESGELRGRGLIFLLLIAGASLLLLLATESFYIVDVFNNRMNTVFKLYYQAWVLQGVAAAVALYLVGAEGRPASKVRSWGHALWWALAILALAAGLWYTAAAFFSKSLALGSSLTLDGLDFVRRSHPAEYEALRWLQGHARGGEVVLEATGPQYSEYGRVSARTGLPTLLGWAGHERQWRGSDEAYRGRDQIIDRIYTTLTPEEAMQLLREYRVSYVYVGHLERSRYEPSSLAKFGGFLEVAFQQDDVTIYRWPAGAEPAEVRAQSSPALSRQPR